MLDPKNATAWYDLLKRFFADLRGPAFAIREARADSITHVFTEVSDIHANYVEMLSAFRDALVRNSETDMDAAKEIFLSQRELFSSRRLEARIGIDALKEHGDMPEAEGLFLRASLSYLVLNEDPFGLAGSMSGLFWSQIRTESDPDKLGKMLEHMSGELATAYSKVIAALLGVDKRHQSLVMRVQKETK